jgi:3-hydroxybutyrate dehydrogenase
MFLGHLKGKTALVTGGGSGISLAFTLRLLEAGCNVVVADLALSPEAQALEKYTTSPKAVFQRTDVTDWAQLDAAFQTALTTFGSLDIVCPGAGLSEPVSFISLRVFQGFRAGSNHSMVLAIQTLQCPTVLG